MRNFNLKAFKKFVEEAGAEILATTNEWEVLRFKANNEVGIVYQNKFGDFKYVMQAKEAYDAFINCKPWKAANSVRRERRSVLLRSLLQRDGKKCFYCGLEMKHREETIEHLFSINQGGTNHISNLALAHQNCNFLARTLSVVEKVKLRDQLRSNQNA